MVWDLKNKVAAVTGGVGGIGYQIVDRLLQKGVQVAIILDIDETKGLEISKNLSAKYGANKAVFIKCDVTKDLDAVFNKIISTYGAVDVLFNNAGIANDKELKKTIELNIQALIEWSLKFWQHMRTDKGGKGGTLVNTASIMGYRAYPFLPVYQSSKFAVMGFTKSLGHKYNYDRSGVRVVAFCPGFTETPLAKDIQTFDDELFSALNEHAKTDAIWQKPDAVGKAAVEVYETANSGTAWLIEGAKPISEVTFIAEVRPLLK